MMRVKRREANFLNKVTVSTLQEMKKKKEKICALTSYDASMAHLLDEAGIEVVLVGDSVGNVKLGYENTLPVTLEEMLHHTKAVKRGIHRALLVVDMPFLTYELDPKEAVRHAGRLVKEGGAEAVKVEGGLTVANSIKAIVQTNIPVMGHLGLTPQAIHRLGGYKVQGRTPQEAEKIVTGAKILEGAGVFAIVLEAIPTRVAREVTEKVAVPTIGIGAGPCCDGQVLVLDDMVGLSENRVPRFVKQYDNVRSRILQAVKSYKKEVRSGQFPSQKYTYE